MTDPTRSPPAAPPDPFDGWAQPLLARQDLNARSVDKYRPLWNAWRDWLHQRDVAWNAATGAQVKAFLAGPTPGQSVRRKAQQPGRMSAYTQQRYWRLLLGVYASAVRDKSCPNNPVLDVPLDKRPTIGKVDRQSQVLPPPMFERLRQPGCIEHLISVTHDANWWQVRDRAILAVLVDTGITTAELLALRGMDIRPSDWQARDPRQADWLHLGPLPLTLDVMANQHDVHRELRLSPHTAGLVTQWMQQRDILLNERAGLSCTLRERPAFMRKHGQEGPLFVARRARLSATSLPPMEPFTLYGTVSQALKRLKASMDAQVSPGSESSSGTAKGAAIIRNSVINHWLLTLGVPETVARAGLKNAESLRLPVLRKEVDR